MSESEAVTANALITRIQELTAENLALNERLSQKEENRIAHHNRMGSWRREIIEDLVETARLHGPMMAYRKAATEICCLKDIILAARGVVESGSIYGDTQREMTGAAAEVCELAKKAAELWGQLFDLQDERMEAEFYRGLGVE